MPETRARFLANTIGATSASNDFTLPDGVGDENQVLSSDGAGGTTWANTLSAPAITSVTGKLNEYEDGVSEDGGVLTINGTDFGNDPSALSVQISGTTGFSTVAETTTISITSAGTQFTATFTGAETNYNHSSFAAGTNIYVKVTKSGLQTSTYATLATAMTGDPSFQTTSTTASSHTGTLPATSLGSYGGAVAGGGQDSNTKLLLNFDRTGGTDIEDSSNTGGDGHKVTATNAVIKASPFGDGKSAIRINGSTHKLQMVNSTDFNLGTSACVEFWIYQESTVTPHNIINHGGVGTADYDGWTIAFQKVTGQDDGISFYRRTSGTSYTLSSGGGYIKTNHWHHVAYTRDGTTARIFIDGKLTNSGSDVTATISNSDPHNRLKVGIEQAEGGGRFAGYIDEIRIVNGSAVYTSDFTVPTSRLTAITNTKLLIHSNLTQTQLYDSSDSNVDIERIGNPTPIPVPSGKWDSGWRIAGHSASDVTNDQYLKVNGNGILTSGDWTIEFWGKDTSSSSTQGWFTYWKDSSNTFKLSNYGQLEFYANIGGTSQNSGSSQTRDTNWHHYAIVYDDSATTLTIYRDGSQTSQNTSFTLDINASSMQGGYFALGARTDNGSDFNQYSSDCTIDDFRITHAKVYTGNFTAPTSALTKTWSANPFGGYNTAANTDSSLVKLLVHGDGAKFTDSSSSNHTITPTGSHHSQDHGGIAPAMTFPASLKKTGSAGVYFDGDGDKLTTDSIPAISGALTIDGWVYTTQNASQYVYDWRDGTEGSGATNGYLFYSSGGGFTFGAIGTASGGAVGSSGVTSFNTNQWYHFCYARDGSGNGAFYLDGTRTSTWTGDTTTTLAKVLTLGSRHTTENDLKGYIDGFRISSSDETASGGSLYHATDGQITLPTQIYGAYRSQDVGTIQLNATAGTGGGALDYAELSGGTALSTYGLSLSSSGAITGTLSGLDDNSNSGGVIRIRARANADDDRVTTLGGSSFTGITQNDGKTPILFNARRYHGSGVTGKDLKNYGFNPDFAWIKRRNGSAHGVLVDSVRGAGSALFSSSTQAVSSTPSINFINNGIELDTHGNVNANDGTYIAWAWKAGGAPSSSTLSLSGGVGAGTISSGISNLSNVTQSVNQNSGFSITKWSGGGATGYFPHNLGAKPDWVIIKRLNSADDWIVWHKDLDSGNSDAGDWIRLDTSDQKGYSGGTDGTSWDYFAGGISTTNIQVTNSTPVNASGSTYICYAWKAVSGVSAFGSYTGTGSTAFTAQNLGFQPKWIMFKNILRSATEWPIHDSFRGNAGGGGSGVGARLYAQVAGGESNDASTQTYSPTITSTGFTFPTTVTHDYWNLSGDTYIYMAFA